MHDVQDFMFVNKKLVKRLRVALNLNLLLSANKTAMKLKMKLHKWLCILVGIH